MLFGRYFLFNHNNKHHPVSMGAPGYAAISDTITPSSQPDPDHPDPDPGKPVTTPERTNLQAGFAACLKNANNF